MFSIIINKKRFVKLINLIIIISLNYYFYLNGENDMELREQKYVLALAECESITKAASRLNISQPALSIYISNLENTLGVKLFNRIGKKLIPTYAGEKYIESAKKIMLLGNNFNMELNDIRTGCKGRLRVGVPIRKSPHVVPAILKRFKEEYPHIEVIIHEGAAGKLGELLLKNEIDLLICNRTVNMSEFEYIPICQDTLLLTVAESHPMADSGINIEGYNYPWINLNKFKDELFILPHQDQSIQFFINKVLDNLNIKPEEIMRIRNIETCAQLASVGYGVSFTLESYAKYFHYENPVKYFIVDDKVFVDCVVTYKKGIYLPAYALRFIHILREIMI